MTERIKNIVLDMGAVLLDTDKQKAIDYFFDSEEEKEIAVREYFKGSEWRDAELGRISVADRYERIKMKIPVSMHEKMWDFMCGWDMAISPVNGAVDFFISHKNTMPMFCQTPISSFMIIFRSFPSGSVFRCGCLFR